MPTCRIEQAACTSGALELTLTASEAINTPNGWIKSSDTVFTKSVEENGIVEVNIEDLA